MTDFLAAVVRLGVSLGLTAGEVRAAVGPLVETKAVRVVRKHYGNRGALLLLGDPGTGKTLAAQRWLMGPAMQPKRWRHDDGSAGWYLLEYGGLFVTARALAQVNQYEPRAMERFFSARALVVDDLGQEYLDKAGFLASLIDHLITERHRRELPTILTANLSAKEYRERYGDRSMSRIMGSGGVEICGGPDLRIKGNLPSTPDEWNVKMTIPGIDPIAVEQRRAELAATRAA